jgi:hypothetical protein
MAAAIWAKQRAAFVRPRLKISSNHDSRGGNQISPSIFRRLAAD